MILRKIARELIMRILKPRWIINGDKELGLRIFGVNLHYYKDSTPLIYTENDGDNMHFTWREVIKRDFGESIKSE